MTDNGQVILNQFKENDAEGVHEAPLLQTFLRGHPKTLGTVQILVGGVMLMFGVVMTILIHAMSARSGILFWGGLMFVNAGALSIATDRKLTVRLVKATFGVNIFCSIIALIGIVLHSLDLAMFSYLIKSSKESFKCVQPWILYLGRSVGISAVMLTLSLLELIIGIYLCVFAYKATFSYRFHPKVEFVPDARGLNISTAENSTQGQGPLIMANDNPQEEN
ncbi:membrane-spanning 4-domains subfamily A member 4A-like [Sardina pilchardus]|uniref:membrane-spanning 4-domains subfamily A member 4A-like n=1 Tax=Sardina pilchardus TaxID=27697 RepID=UPI002E1595E2